MTVTTGARGNFDIVGVGRDQFFELFFGDHLLKRHEGDVVTKALAEFGGNVVVQAAD